MTFDGLITATLLGLAVFLVLWGVGIFVSTFRPRPGIRWWTRYAYAAAILTCAYYLFRLVFDVP